MRELLLKFVVPAALFMLIALPGAALAQERQTEQPDEDLGTVEVQDISNYKLSDFKWGEQTQGDFMLGTFKGKDAFTGDLAKEFPGEVMVRIKLRNAQVVDSYLTYNNRRISEPITPSVERVLLRRPEWNRGPDCNPRRQIFTYKRRVRQKVQMCYAVLIVPPNCPARIESLVCRVTAHRSPGRSTH